MLPAGTSANMPLRGGQSRRSGRLKEPLQTLRLRRLVPFQPNGLMHDQPRRSSRLKIRTF
jgi:hypothetical protein